MVGLAVIAAVSADVSHLQGGSNGYNYPQPSPSFNDEQLALPEPPKPVNQKYLPPPQPQPQPAASAPVSVQAPTQRYIPPPPPAPVVSNIPTFFFVHAPCMAGIDLVEFSIFENILSIKRKIIFLTIIQMEHTLLC